MNGNSIRMAEKDISGEPMMKAARAALAQVSETGDLIAHEILAGIDNNGAHKLRQSLTASLQDPKGDSRAYFAAQHRALSRIGASCRSNGLIDGVAQEQARGRALS